MSVVQLYQKDHSFLLRESLIQLLDGIYRIKILAQMSFMN